MVVGRGAISQGTIVLTDVKSYVTQIGPALKLYVRLKLGSTVNVVIDSSIQSVNHNQIEILLNVIQSVGNIRETKSLLKLSKPEVKN